MTLSVRMHLDTPYVAGQLAPLKAVLETSRTSVTFWGTRTVCAAGNDDFVALDKVAWKVLGASRSLYHSCDMAPAERIAGIGMVDILQRFYQATDQQISRANCLTKLFVSLREFHFYIPGIVSWGNTNRFYIEGEAPFYTCCKTDFQTYSAAKFTELFGCDPIVDHNHYTLPGGLWPQLNEDIIRSQWVQSLPDPIDLTQDLSACTKERVEWWLRGHLYPVSLRPVGARNFIMSHLLVRDAVEILAHSRGSSSSRIEDWGLSEGDAQVMQQALESIRSFRAENQLGQ